MLICTNPKSLKGRKASCLGHVGTIIAAGKRDVTIELGDAKFIVARHGEYEVVK